MRLRSRGRDKTRCGNPNSRRCFVYRALLLLSIVLGIVPLAGIAWILLVGSITTVDSMFMSLILLTLSGLFFSERLLGTPRSRLPYFPEKKLAGHLPAQTLRNPFTPSTIHVLLVGPGRRSGRKSFAGRLHSFETPPVGVREKEIVNGLCNCRAMHRHKRLRLRRCLPGRLHPSTQG